MLNSPYETVSLIFFVTGTGTRRRSFAAAKKFAIREGYHVHPTQELFALGLVPAALFVYAQRMKDEDRPEDWQLAHGLWHASGAAVACAATYSIS